MKTKILSLAIASLLIGGVVVIANPADAFMEQEGCVFFGVEEGSLEWEELIEQRQARIIISEEERAARLEKRMVEMEEWMNMSSEERKELMEQRKSEIEEMRGEGFRNERWNRSSLGKGNFSR